MHQTQRRTANPRTAAIWAVLIGEFTGRPPGRVVDVGGGTGGFAVPLAQVGHQVTVIDPSPDALAALTRRAAEAGVGPSVSAVQGDADRLADVVRPGSADLVLCHSLLEVVDDPAAVLGALADVLCPGGTLSMLVANRAAAVLSRATTGHLAEASAMLADPDGRDGPDDKPRRRFDPDQAAALVRGAGLTVEKIQGIRTVVDLIPGTLADDDPEALLAFELATADLPPYRDIATQLHVYARRR